MKLLELSPKVFQYYRNELRGNEHEHDSYDLARRKMTRNMMLAKELNSTGYTAKKYCYGSLHFLVVDGKVVWIKNKCKTTGWELDKQKYVYWNKELKIDGKSKAELVKKDMKYFYFHSKSKLKKKLRKNFLVQ